jgi:hypothetical protein
MADLISMLAAAGGTEGEATDEYFQNTTLLLHGDGTNGAQNNTFLDSSTNAFTITRNGNTTQGTFTPFSKPDGRWGTFFDGTDDYLIVADNAALRPGAGAFTLEAWIYRNAAGAAHNIYAKGGASTGINFQVTSGNVLRFSHTTTSIDSTGTIPQATWTHVAVVREGTGTNQTKLYINGVNDGQGTVSTDFTQTEEVRIGTNRSAGDDFNGYISNVRFVKGSALYTGNFTPSTSPFTTTSQGASSSEVELLTCQSNRFLDNSTNAFAVTTSGTPKATPFSPFPLKTAYTPSINGGSGYFDGSGDYLLGPSGDVNIILASSFTVEAWVYPIAQGGIFTLRGADTNGWAMSNKNGVALRTNTVQIGYAPTPVTEINFTDLSLNTWSHIAFVKNGSSGTNLTVYINGVSAGTGSYTTTTTIGDGTDRFGIGFYDNYIGSIREPLNGYISSLRVTNAAVYTSAFTPPTGPLTAITDTQLLMNFTNAGIFDNTGFNVLETVGNAQIDTSVKKYGTGSMEFDGSGDFLSLITSRDTTLHQIGNWTYEGWIRWKTLPTTGFQNIFGQGAAGQSSFGLTAINASNNWTPPLKFAVNQANAGTRILGTTTIAVDTWYYFAVVRSSGVITLYVDGVSEGTYSNSTNYAFGNNVFTIGNNSNCYIDDFRFTQGIARYTTTFTPPTAAFPNIGE